jgi:circadian clock protein KaiB
LSTAAPADNAASDDTLQLRLYVVGQSPKSVAAFNNLTRLCEQRLATPFSIEVVDLLENPELAREDQILAIPTLVRRSPAPMHRVIGDLSDGERVLRGLDISSSAIASADHRGASPASGSI